MKKLVLFTLLAINFISCNRKNSCEKDCPGIDKSSIEYQFSPTLEKKDSLVFKCQESDEILKLNLNSFSLTEPYVEEKCDGFAYDANCKGYTTGEYTYNYKDSSSVFYFNISFYYDEKYEGGREIIYQISFDKMPNKSADFMYKYGSFKLNALPALKYSSELRGDTLSFTNNEENYNINTINKMWIKKNEGIIKIKLDDKIWIKQ